MGGTFERRPPSGRNEHVNKQRGWASKKILVGQLRVYNTSPAQRQVVSPDTMSLNTEELKDAMKDWIANRKVTIHQNHPPNPDNKHSHLTLRCNWTNNRCSHLIAPGATKNKGSEMGSGVWETGQSLRHLRPLWCPSRWRPRSSICSYLSLSLHTFYELWIYTLEKKKKKSQPLLNGYVLLDQQLREITARNFSGIRGRRKTTYLSF